MPPSTLCLRDFPKLEKLPGAVTAGEPAASPFGSWRGRALPSGLGRLPSSLVGDAAPGSYCPVSVGLGAHSAFVFLTPSTVHGACGPAGARGPRLGHHRFVPRLQASKGFHVFQSLSTSAFTLHPQSRAVAARNPWLKAPQLHTPGPWKQQHPDP